MTRTAKIASELCNKEITTSDAFQILMALKLSRLSYSPDHFDSFVDLMGYAEGYWKYRSDPKYKVQTEEDIWSVRESISQAESATKLEHLLKISSAIQLLSSEGYRIFGPELDTMKNESIDWKDQPNNEHYRD